MFMGYSLFNKPSKILPCLFFSNGVTDMCHQIFSIFFVPFMAVVMQYVLQVYTGLILPHPCEQVDVITPAEQTMLLMFAHEEDNGESVVRVTH